MVAVNAEVYFIKLNHGIWFKQEEINRRKVEEEWYSISLNSVSWTDVLYEAGCTDSKMWYSKDSQQQQNYISQDYHSTSISFD